MLYIDGITLKYLKTELEDELLNRKITKIFQYDRFNVSLFFGKLNLYFSINPSLAITYISKNKMEAPAKPLLFSLSLRKCLLNSKLIKIEQFSSDRILIFSFSKINEIGENRIYKLIIELMGKHSNLTLCDEDNKIVDILKRFSLEENKFRVLMPGADYKSPILEEKFDPYKLSEIEFNENINSLSDFTKIEGFGKYSALEVGSHFENYKKLLSQDAKPVCFYQDSQIKFASFIKYKHFENLECVEYDNINEMINDYVEKTINSQQFFQHKSKLDRIIQGEMKKNKKILKFIAKDLKKNSNYIKYKNIGDILAANLYQIKAKESEVVLFDFYSNEDITISLNPDLNPNQNLDKYYKKYNKLKRGENFALKRKIEIEKELEYLFSIDNFLKSADELDIIKSIEEELKEGSYLKVKKSKKKVKNKSSIVKLKSSEGFDIYLGKNNRDNDYITFKLADKRDIWFHAKDIPGSHVLIKIESNLGLVGDKSIEEAAALAAFYSKSKNEAKVLVDYTEKTYIKKPKNAKPGFVTYKNEKSIYIEPKSKILDTD